MTRYEQRKIKFLQDSEVAESYQEMATELQSMQSLASFIQQKEDQTNQASSSSRPLTPE